MTAVFANTEHLPGLAELIARRKKLGQDGYDEVWDGVYHVAATSRFGHGRLQLQLGVVLTGLAPSGLIVGGPANIGSGEQDHRVPDLVVLREPADDTLLWLPTAAMVVEVRSPGDETYAKFGFYGAHGVEEILVADPTEQELALFVGDPLGQYQQSEVSAVFGVDVQQLAHDLRWS